MDEQDSDDSSVSGDDDINEAWSFDEDAHQYSTIYLQKQQISFDKVAALMREVLVHVEAPDEVRGDDLQLIQSQKF